MTYKIIGGDGREYGPVSDADLRKWIADGRINAQSLAKSETDAEFRPLSTFSEFADFFGTSPPPPPAAAPAAPPIDWNKRDYELDIGGCFSRGWTLFMDNIGILLGCSALYLVVWGGGSGIVNGVVGGLLGQCAPDTMVYSAPFMIVQAILLQTIIAVFVGPVAGGYYYVLIRTLRGESATVGDLFSGFQKAFSQLFLGLLVNNLLMVLCSIPFYIVWCARAGPVLVDLTHSPTPRELRGLLMDLWSATTSSGPILILCMIPSIYLAINLIFTLPLIMDKGMDVWTAIGVSWKMVHKHWFTVFGLVLLVAIISAVAGVLCCVPLFFTLGITTAALMYAYETIFCERSRH